LVRLGGNDQQFIHVCGAGNLDPQLDEHPHYRQFEYLHAGFADALACSDLVISRGGANSLSELTAMKKPAIIVPLPRGASRGDQIENARRHAQKGYGVVLPQSELSAARLRKEIEVMLTRKGELIAAMQRDILPDGAETLVRVIEELIEEQR
jgi:UDP-N-acetylglucosamine--N-acetylmuramyl-(pentapeptide) pyrophosphoryl-undecaprenol N-acetylglucosamine transferase